MNGNQKKIGLISDTHNFFDPQLTHVFSDCDEIWHAGDIGDINVIRQLEKIKPVRAVYGNIDDLEITSIYLEDLWITHGSLLIYITHIADRLPKYNKRVIENIKSKKPDILICGHSHILKVAPDKANNLIYINPGAAGQHGFHTMRTIIKMNLEHNKVSNMEVVELGRRGRIPSN